MQEIEHRTGRPFAHLRKLFRGLRAAQLQQGGTRSWVRGEYPEEALKVLSDLGVEVGPATWDAERVGP